METEISHSKTLHFIEKILKHFSTPVLIMDLSIIEENFNQLKQIKNSKIFYQVKQNSNKYILQFLSDLNSNFDTQSKSEIETILSLGVSPDRISFGNTIKSAEDIKYQYQRGIRLFQVDCEMEIEKIQLYAPESQVFVRIQVPTSQDQDYPLTGKFGTSKEHQVSLVKLQLERKLKPIGVSFHVGSQNYNPESWRIQIKEQSYIFEEIKKEGYKLRMINIGGGLPVRYNKPIPPIEEYIKVINESISEYLGNDIEVFVEPGRSMVGNQGILLTDIILKSKKPDGKEWLYTNLGVFHGLFEITQGVKIPVEDCLEVIKVYWLIQM